MRTAMVLDWFMNASSLMNIARNMFRELGDLMNQTRSFTVAGIKKSSIGIGDINLHYDLVHIPNMGGFRFIENGALSCKNLILGLSGIDEVIYGKDVFVDKNRWKTEQPIIKREVQRWKTNISKIKAIHVAANSEADEMNKYLGIPKNKMTVIPHGVDNSIFKRAINKSQTRRKILFDFRIFPMSRYFIHVGEQNWKRKNLLCLLDAYEIAKIRGLKHKLICVGRYNDEFITKKAKNISGIHLLGYVSNEYLVSLLQGADALLMPSIHEGFGMPLVEAMACSTPCIVSNRHAPPEVVGESGLLVDPENIDDIAEKMIAVSKNDNSLNELSQKAFERSKNFSWGENTSQILDLYKKIIPDQDKPFNFEESYEIAAYRTLTTVCEMYPDEKQHLIDSLLRFDYSMMIKWAANYGLDDPNTKDFLIPFQEWIYNKNK